MGIEFSVMAIFMFIFTERKWFQMEIYELVVDLNSRFIEEAALMARE